TALNGKGENVKYDLNLYDQYGGSIAYNSLSDYSATTLIWNDFIDSKDVTYEIEDNGNDIPEVKISLINDLDKAGDFNFTVFNQAATATGKITVNSAKVANKIQIGDLNDVIAAGDKDVYVPVIAYDAQGNQLSTEDLTSEQNVKRISVSLSGAVGDNDATSVSIEDSGEHKGSIKLHEVKANAKGAVSITAVIATANASSTATKTYTVSDARVPDHFKEVTAPSKSIVPGGESKFEYSVIDQYGQVLDDSLNVNTTTGYVDAAGSHYTVEVGAVTSSAVNNSSSNTNAYVLAPVYGKLDGVKVYDNTGANDFKKFNDEFKFVTTAAAKDEKVEFTARIMKTTPGATSPTEIAKLTKTMNVAQSTEDLTYAVKEVGSIFNTLDSGIIDADHQYGTSLTITKGEQLSAASSLLAKEIEITAKNAAGDLVELPAQITQVTSSNNSVARVELGTGDNAGKAFVIGNKAG
ncbi:S-layer homology domain-containing protein, partial [Paenibacillus alba]|nr:S-layer homology domain-containing protein [Paenibacillus alba]